MVSLFVDQSLKINESTEEKNSKLLNRKASTFSHERTILLETLQHECKLFTFILRCTNIFIFYITIVLNCKECCAFYKKNSFSIQ